MTFRKVLAGLAASAAMAIASPAFADSVTLGSGDIGTSFTLFVVPSFYILVAENRRPKTV